MTKPDITTLDKLLPLVAEAKTCKEFGAIVLEHVPVDLRRGLARAARDALGLPWRNASLDERIKPSFHGADQVEARRQATLLYRSNPEKQQRNREAVAANKRANRLDCIIHNCGSSSRHRGHTFDSEDAAYLRGLWNKAKISGGPWRGLVDFTAYGEERTGGDPWAPSFDRVDNSRGYQAGNVRLVPNVWNKTCQQYDRRLVAELTAMASTMRAEGHRASGDLEALRAARPWRRTLQTHLAGKAANVFKSHPALIPFEADMMAATLHKLYGPNGGVCEATGLPFVAEPGHPCFPSWDLLDHSKTGKRVWKNRQALSTKLGKEARRRHRVVSTEPGTERPEDMRLVCTFFNLGRSKWEDSVWWKMADRVRELVDAGRIVEL